MAKNITQGNIDFTVNNTENVGGFATKRTNSSLITDDNKYDVVFKQYLIDNDEEASGGGFSVNAIDIDWNEAQINGATMTTSGEVLSHLQTAYSNATSALTKANSLTSKVNGLATGIATGINSLDDRVGQLESVTKVNISSVRWVSDRNELKYNATGELYFNTDVNAKTLDAQISPDLKDYLKITGFTETHDPEPQTTHGIIVKNINRSGTNKLMSELSDAKITFTVLPTNDTDRLPSFGYLAGSNETWNNLTLESGNVSQISILSYNWAGQTDLSYGGTGNIVVETNTYAMLSYQLSYSLNDLITITDMKTGDAATSSATNTQIHTITVKNINTTNETRTMDNSSYTAYFTANPYASYSALSCSACMDQTISPWNQLTLRSGNPPIKLQPIPMEGWTSFPTDNLKYGDVGTITFTTPDAAVITTQLSYDAQEHINIIGQRSIGQTSGNFQHTITLKNKSISGLTNIDNRLFEGSYMLTISAIPTGHSAIEAYYSNSYVLNSHTWSLLSPSIITSNSYIDIYGDDSNLSDTGYIGYLSYYYHVPNNYEQPASGTDVPAGGSYNAYAIITVQTDVAVEVSNMSSNFVNRTVGIEGIDDDATEQDIYINRPDFGDSAAHNKFEIKIRNNNFGQNKVLFDKNNYIELTLTPGCRDNEVKGYVDKTIKLNKKMNVHYVNVTTQADAFHANKNIICSQNKGQENI